MKTIALKMSEAIGFTKSNVLNAVLWALVGLVATYLTTTTAEAQISGQAFCSLFTNDFQGYHSMAAVGHCAWCYAALAAFGASAISLFKKA
jgi:hypothetical protein